MIALYNTNFIYYPKFYTMALETYCRYALITKKDKVFRDYASKKGRVLLANSRKHTEC